MRKRIIAHPMTIRRTPADFVVTERLTPAFADSLRTLPDPRARHAIYRLEKTSLTTPEAISFFAKELRVSPVAIEYAGLKDKHAVTRQHISVALTKEQRDRAGASVTTQRAVRAELIGWSEAPITAPAIEANHFAIVIRDLTRAAVGEINARAARLTDHPGSLLITNYFGDQRFGSARHEQGFAARHLITGDFENALRLLIGTPARKDTGSKRAFTRLCATHWGDWKRLAAELPRCPERRAIEELAAGKTPRDAFALLPNFLQQLSVDAYQSFLWNEIARRCLTAIEPQAIISAEDAFGSMLFPHAACVPQDRRDVRIPLPSASMRPDPRIAAAVFETLSEQGIRGVDLRVPGLRRPAFGESDRPLFVIARDFAAGRAEPDDLGRTGRLKREVSFSLPSSAYATTVLRALGQ